MNIPALINAAFQAGSVAAKGHASDLKNYLETRARLIAQGAADIAADRLANNIDDNDVRFAWDEIKNSEDTARLAVQATLQAATQDAINAMLSVAATAVNSAIGIAIL